VNSSESAESSTAFTAHLDKNFSAEREINLVDCPQFPPQLRETIEDREDLRSDVKSKNEKIFQISFTIRTYSKSEKAMKRQCDLLRRICQNHGNMLIPCDYQQEDGLCARFLSVLQKFQICVDCTHRV
jgi:hypothetical protein